MKITRKKLVELFMIILEIFCSIVFAQNALNVITTKAYDGYFSFKNIALAMIFGIIVVIIILHIYLKNKNKIEKIFFITALATGIVFSIFILPFNVPDEETHFIKAYDISVGHILPNVESDGMSYCTIPRRLETCSCIYFNSYKTIYDEINQKTDYNDEMQMTCTAQGNSALLYIGTVISIIICRTLNLNILFALYLGRILNLLIFLSFTYFAIKKIPFGKLALAVLCFFPIMMQQSASCSADAVLNAVLIYYIVHLIYLVYKEEKINLKDKIILFILTILIAMFKYIYILVAGILFLNLFKKKDERKEWKKTIAIMICLGSVFMIGWFVFNLRFDSTSDNIKEYYTAIGIDSTSQIQYIKEHPARFVKVILRQFIIFGTDSLYSAIGSHLGWLNVEINSGVILGFFVLTLYAVVSEENNYEFNTKSKIWILLIYVAISTLIKLGMYLYSTPVGNDMVCGVQGRYYTPILILPILCLIKKDKNYKVKYLYEKVIVVSLFLSMFTIYCVIRNYI